MIVSGSNSGLVAAGEISISAVASASFGFPEAGPAGQVTLVGGEELVVTDQGGIFAFTSTSSDGASSAR